MRPRPRLSLARKFSFFVQKHDEWFHMGTYFILSLAVAVCDFTFYFYTCVDINRHVFTQEKYF